MIQDTEYPPSINILIIDDYIGDAEITKLELKKHFSGVFSPIFNHQRFPEKGLEVLAQNNTDLVILDPNTNTLNPRNRLGIRDFLEPMRTQGYQTPVICFTISQCMSMDEALAAGATAYAPKEDYEALFRTLDEIYQPVHA